MLSVNYREALIADVPALARIRAAQWETEQYWARRISGYMEGTLHPHHAFRSRALLVAVEGEMVVGLVAGHLTSRFGCQGELQWVDVVRERSRLGIGSEMARLLARWFVQNAARKVCVDPGNLPARGFYARLGAHNLNPHWMFWPDISAVLKPSSTGASASEC